MKSTKAFANVIGEFIESEKKADALFAKCVDDQPQKTIQGCVNYILKQVKDSGCNGFTDDEVFGMARHFYDERDLKDPGDMKARVVINRQIELTEEEKEKARKAAVSAYEKAERDKLEAQAKKRAEAEAKRAEAKRKAAEEKRERENAMQLDLFA